MSISFQKGPGSRWKNAMWVFFGCVLVIVLGFAFLVGRELYRQVRASTSVGMHQGSLAERVASSTPVTSQEQYATTVGNRDPFFGNSTAKHTIIEYLDYQCPYSAKTASVVREFATAHAMDVKFIIRDFPLESIHDAAMGASLAARCVYRIGGPERFAQYHDQLFLHQDQLDLERLRNDASQIGIDLTAYDACMNRREESAAIQRSLQDGIAAEVRGTPTFFIDGYRLEGAVDRTTLEDVYRAIVAK